MLSMANLRLYLKSALFNKISGQLPKRAIRLIKQWANLCKDELMEQWNKAKALEKPDKIDPLK